MLTIIKGYWLIQIEVNLLSGNIISSSVSIIPEKIGSLSLFPSGTCSSFAPPPSPPPPRYISSQCHSILLGDLFLKDLFSGLVFSTFDVAIAAMPGVSQHLYSALNSRQLCTVFSGRDFHLSSNHRHLNSHICMRRGYVFIHSPYVRSVNKDCLNVRALDLDLQPVW